MLIWRVKFDVSPAWSVCDPMDWPPKRNAGAAEEPFVGSEVTCPTGETPPRTILFKGDDAFSGVAGPPPEPHPDITTAAQLSAIESRSAIRSCV